MIYLLTDFLEMDDEEYDSLLKKLPKQRVEKIKKYRFREDRIRSALSCYLLLYGIELEYGRWMADEDWYFNPFGKPFLNLDERIFFNISHCKNAIGVAISKQNVGIDVQEKSEMLDEIFDYYKIKIDRSFESLERYWTLIEAYGKYIGVGLNYEIEQLDFSTIRDNRWQEFKGIRVYSQHQNEFSISVFSDLTLEIKKINLRKDIVT